MNKKYTKDQLEIIVLKSGSYRQVLNSLNLKEAGGNYKNIKERINQFNIDVSHFHGKGWNKGKTWNKFVDLDKILSENSVYKSGLPYSTYRVKSLLFKHKLKEEICENCDLTHWLNKKIPLELHHINGDNKDNRILNLQILCPNCHTLTDNYRGKKLKKAQ